MMMQVITMMLNNNKHDYQYKSDGDSWIAVGDPSCLNPEFLNKPISTQMDHG